MSNDDDGKKRWYEFAVWPDERRWERSVYQLFRMGLQARVGEMFTAAEFASFSESLGRQGLTLREVEISDTSPWDETHLDCGIRDAPCPYHATDATDLAAHQRNHEAFHEAMRRLNDT